MAQFSPAVANIPVPVLEKYKKRFDAIDLNKDGKISLREFAAVGRVFGYDLSYEELQDIFGKRDLDESGAITFDEFVIAMIERAKMNQAIAPIKEQFRVYDYRGRGYITADEAYPILSRELGFDMNKTESLVDMYDKNRDYRLSIHEFKSFLEKVNELKAKVQAAFREFDKDGDGYISYEEMRQTMLPRGYQDNEIYNIILKYDKDGDSRLNFEEFARFWDVPIF